MNRNNIIFICIAICFGYFLGKPKNDNGFSNINSHYVPPYLSPSNSSIDLKTENEALRARLDDARYKADDAVRAAEDIEFDASMRAVTTGRFEDMLKGWDAEDAANKARELRSSLDD